jgi:L-Ala-D/L-Glu epimerase / N-acetyl-D-glutamate racemase
MPARIAKVEVFAVEVPRRATFSLHRGTTPTVSRFTLVKLTEESGITGWGETAFPFAPYAQVLRDYIAPIAQGADPAEIDAIHRGIDRTEMMVMERVGYWNPARATLDIALHDLTGKLLHVPVWKLLGERHRHIIPMVKNVGVAPTDETRRAAEALVAEGYTVVKVRVGSDLETDIERVTAVREAIPVVVPIRIDANQAWSLEEAAAALERMAPFGLESIEQPLGRLDLSGARELRARTRVPLIADEGFWTADEARLLASAGAADVLHLYLSKCGGLLPARRIADAAVAAGLDVTLGERVPLGICEAADAHFAASLADLRYPCALSYDLNAHDLLKRSLRRERGALYLPEGDGLGIDVDEDQVARYTIE